MFDDGYKDLCRNIVSIFKHNSSAGKSIADVYCGCVEYLEQETESVSAEQMSVAVTERA